MDLWQTVWTSIADDFHDMMEIDRLTHVAVRLVFAAIVGGLLGLERELAGKEAGLRTHMLVCVGAALFVLIPQLEGLDVADMSRVIQGIVTGVGFLGAGTILKQEEERRIHGLTTAAGIWLTAAVGIGVGIGRLGSALLGSLMAFVILSLIAKFENRFAYRRRHKDKQ
jgi:putative Mg2+ transporter-C (MgtC) family protein